MRKIIQKRPTSRGLALELLTIAIIAALPMSCKRSGSLISPANFNETGVPIKIRIVQIDPNFTVFFKFSDGEEDSFDLRSLVTGRDLQKVVYRLNRASSVLIGSELSQEGGKPTYRVWIDGEELR